MSDLTPKAVYSAYRDDQKAGPLHRPLFVARVLAIAVACLGAIPTGYNLYISFAHGIPFWDVSHRLEQFDLWKKNFDCKIDYRMVSAGGDKGTRIDVGACPKSNDIALKLTAPDGRSAYEWIAYNQLEQSTKVTSLLSLFVTEAQAEEAPKVDGATVQPAARMAQATTGPMQVRCEVMEKPGQIIRIVNEGGKCYREHISAMRGKLDKREEVPCNTQCTPAKG